MARQNPVCFDPLSLASSLRATSLSSSRAVFAVAVVTSTNMKMLVKTISDSIIVGCRLSVVGYRLFLPTMFVADNRQFVIVFFLYGVVNCWSPAVIFLMIEIFVPTTDNRERSTILVVLFAAFFPTDSFRPYRFRDRNLPDGACRG